MLYGRDIPDYTVVKDHVERLLREGEANRLARAARGAHNRLSVSAVLAGLAGRVARAGMRWGAPRRDGVHAIRAAESPSLRRSPSHARSIPLTDAVTLRIVAAGRRRLARRARRRAIERFAVLHPRWHASLFDDSLVATLPMEGGGCRARRLIDAWLAQVESRPAAPSSLDADALDRVARAFVALLEEEEGALSLSPR